MNKAFNDIIFMLLLFDGSVQMTIEKILDHIINWLTINRYNFAQNSS